MGRQATIIQETGQFADVNSFSSEAGTLPRVPIVDAVISYDCPFSLKSYLLVAKNALFVQSMEHNLIPPFIMREAGLVVDETAKIHAARPTVENHSIFDRETKLRIPLSLRGIFSCFQTRALTSDEREHCESYDAIFLTPDADAWDPYDQSWAYQEDSLLDSEGDIVQREPKERVHLIEQPDFDISAFEGDAVPVERFEAAVDARIASAFAGNPQDACMVDECLILEDAIRAHISASDAASDPDLLAASTAERLLVSKFAMAMGATSIDPSGCSLFEATEEAPASIGATTAARRKGVTAEHLAKVWRIPHKMAEETLAVTTQLNRRGGDTALGREFGTNDRMLRYKRITSWFFTDTFFVTDAARSTRGNKMFQLFVSDKGYVKVYCMKSLKEYPKALRKFAKDVGAPEVLVADPHSSHKSAEVKDFLNKIGTTLRLLEQSTQFANRAELYGGLVKEAVRKDMREQNSPLVLWDYCVERRAKIFSLTARDLFQLNGTNPHTATFGDEGDISNLCQFDWYQWCWYFDETSALRFPFQKAALGRCLGPAENEGNEMSQWVLKQNGQVVPRRTLVPLTAEQLAPSNEVEAKRRADYDADIRSKLGDCMKLPTIVEDSDEDEDPVVEIDDPDFRPYEDDETPPSVMPEADIVDNAGRPICQQSMTDLLVNAEVLLPQGEELQLAKVVGQSFDANGKVIGRFDENPLLNSLVYDVRFPDGTVKEYAANVIAGNVLSQSDSDGHFSSELSQIVDHKRDGTAVPKSQKYFVTKKGKWRGQKKRRQTTQGWQMLVEWRDGTRAWLPLKDMKESHPVDVAEYAKARGIDDEAAFEWWVPYTLRKRDMIVSAVNSRVQRRSHKYGVEVPRSVHEAKLLDAKNGNTFWMDAIRKEMANVGIAFEILGEGEKAPPGWHKASGHLIFDVKMDFTRKARWVKDGHRTPDPTTSAYAGVVSRESVRIALTHAALMGLDVWAADIQNAYLQAPSSEKHFIICGPEFGAEHAGKVALIRRALYGGKVAGRDFWHHLRKFMHEELGFESSKADPDVWYRPATKKDGSQYYEYVLLYVDDCLVISENAEAIVRKEIGEHFKLKEDSIGRPSQYLGGKLREVRLANGQEAWAFGSSQYVQAAVTNVEECLAKKGKQLVAKAPSPLSNGYRPEVDVSQELLEEDASYYHSLIGILRWIVELGRADIATEVSMMSSHLALPRAGHLEQVLHIFAYLKKHHNAEMVFDPSEVEFDRSDFERKDWSYSIYNSSDTDLKEQLPPGMPTPRGRGFCMRVYVDSDHAGDTVTRRSRSGFVVFLNNAPIYWSSKKQTSCETSTFGSEFIAMKQACEYTRGLRYKLRMMGIPVDEPSFIYGDNQSVLCNTMMPESTLKKKTQSIAYHFVREGCARDEWRTAYISTHENVADLMTKPLAGGEKRWKFVRMLLHHL